MQHHDWSTRLTCLVPLGLNLTRMELFLSVSIRKTGALTAPAEPLQLMLQTWNHTDLMNVLFSGCSLVD